MECILLQGAYKAKTQIEYTSFNDEDDNINKICFGGLKEKVYAVTLSSAMLHAS